MICSAFLNFQLSSVGRRYQGFQCVCVTQFCDVVIFLRRLNIGLITLQIGPIQHFALLLQCFCMCCSHGVQVNSVCDVLMFLLLKYVMYCSGHIFLIDVLSLAMLPSYVVWGENTNWNVYCARWACSTELCHMQANHSGKEELRLSPHWIMILNIYGNGSGTNFSPSAPDYLSDYRKLKQMGNDTDWFFILLLLFFYLCLVSCTDQPVMN